MRTAGVRGMATVFLCVLAFPLLAQGSGVACPDPHAVLKAFYESNDARTYQASMKYVADDATVDTWATGVNGYIMAKRHREGKTAIRMFLPEGRGLRMHLPDSAPDGPVFHESRLSVSGNIVQFMLEPDRMRPDGRPYNPFSVQAVLDGCRIKSLIVIERVTWL